MTFTTYYRNLLDEARERGRNWARTCAALILTPEDAEYLENDAKAMAQRISTTPFDSTMNADDRLKADDHEKSLRELDDAEMSLTQAAVAVREREQDLARLGPESSAPAASTWLIVGGVVLFAAGFALAIFDWVHDRIADPYLAALVALVPSVALGIFVVRCLTHPDSPRSRTVGLVAGIGISIAVGVLRYAFAPDEPILAIACTLLEGFVLLCLDWWGKHLQVCHQKWLIEHEAHGKAEHLLAAARQLHERVAARVAVLKQAIAAHLEEVTIRALCFQKLSEIESALANAIIGGAHAGIAENQGLKRGVVISNNNSTPVVL